MAQKNPEHSRSRQHFVGRRGDVDKQLELLANLQRTTNETLTQKLMQVGRRKIELQREILDLSTPLACKKDGLTESLDEIVHGIEKTMAQVEEALDAKLGEVCKLEQDFEQAQSSLMAYRSKIQLKREEANGRIRQVLDSIPTESNCAEIDRLKNEVAALLEQKKAAELHEQQLRDKILAMKLPTMETMMLGHEEER